MSQHSDEALEYSQHYLQLYTYDGPDEGMHWLWEFNKRIPSALFFTLETVITSIDYLIDSVEETII